MTMTKSMLSAMRQYMDEMTSKTSYCLQELKDNGIIYTTYFDTKEKAKYYARKLCDDTSSMYLFKTNCIRVYDPVESDEVADEVVDEVVEDEQEEYIPNIDLSDMTLYEYGKGYILCPPENSEFYGKKYFHNGWWMKSQNGWFFKQEHYQWLMDNGVMIEDDEEVVEQTTTDMSNMTLWQYGAGYLLVPDSTDEYYGEKYFNGGWWMPKQHGWFFKSEFYQMIVDNGVVFGTADENEQVLETEVIVSDDDEESPDLSMMTINEYKKGYLLMPPKDNAHYGEKYFYDGWWMPTQNGWFFKKEFKEWLLEHGGSMMTAKTSKTSKTSKTAKTAKTTKTTKTGVEDLSDMTLETYKLGYILKTDKSDKRFGEKYFMDGFWNESQQGWFFRSKYMDMLVDCGVKVIKSEPVTTQEKEQETITTELSSSITNDSFEYVHGDSEFMTSENKAVPNFKKYGKGWLLKADKNYKYNKVNYFEGGWWMEANKGWFFKKADKEKFMKTHFEI